MSDSANPQVSPRILAAGMAITALVSGTLYVLTLAPTVTGEDSGELIAAAYTLGIPHPPGYPLWCLTTHAAIKLIPFGEIAWRANLVSAMFGVLAACTVTAIVMRLTASLLAGLTGGLSFAFAHEVWKQSTIAEVYTQYAFLFALTLYFVIRWRDTGVPRTLYGAALAGGLGVVAHGLMILPLPVFVVAALWPRTGEWVKAKHVAIGAAAFAAPFLLLLYLPIRSASNPPFDWGNPEMFGAFWDVMTRAQYSELFLGNPHSFSLFFKQFLFFFKEVQNQGVLLFGLVGLYVTILVWRPLGFILLALFLMTSLGSIFLTNFPIELPDLWLNTAYWLPVHVILAISVGFFGSRLWWSRVSPKLSARYLRGIPIALAAIAIGLPLYELFGVWRVQDYRGNRYVYEFAENAFLTLPENAVFVGGGDHTLFPLLYLQIVEGRRPDVTIANPYGYIDMPRIDGLAEAFPGEAENTIPSEESEPAMIEWIARHSGRPVYSANPYKLEGLRGTRHGFLYRIAAPEDALDDPFSIWNRYVFHERPNVNDWTARLIQFDYFAAAAERDIAKGNADQARIYLLSASTFANWDYHYGGGDKHSLNNIAIIAARGGIEDLALEFWIRALEIDPDFEIAKRNLERYRLRQAN